MIFFLGFKGPPPHSKSKVVHHGRLKPNHRENIPNWLKPSSSWSFCVLSPIAQSPSLKNTKVFNESLIFCCWLSHVSMYHIKICYSTDFHEVLIKLVSFQTSAFTNVGFAQTLNLKNASSVNDTWWNSTVASDINAAISSRFLTALTIIERSVPLLPFANRKTRKSSPDDAADFDNFKKSLSSQVGFHYSSS